jgi:hypothetical protein
LKRFLKDGIKFRRHLPSPVCACSSSVLSSHIFRTMQNG